jgi:hypothetical protein
MIIHSITFVLNFNAEHAEKTHIFVQNLSVVSTTSACLPPLYRSSEIESIPFVPFIYIRTLIPV